MATNYPTEHEDAPPKQTAPTIEKLEEQVLSQARRLVDFVRDPRNGEAELSLKEMERRLAPLIFDLGCAALTLFLACCEVRVEKSLPSKLVSGGRRFKKSIAKARTVTTWFGLVRYWRTYMEEQVSGGDGHGFFPLDHTVGLTKEKFSFSLLSAMVRLATLVSFATAKQTGEMFLPSVPSTEVIEQATLGLGRYTEQWFEQDDPPDNDGDVLVILFDGKGTPQATEEELVLRRQSWKDRPRALSPRHRGRDKRGKSQKKPRHHSEEDDDEDESKSKSKNARMATMVVMYTLRRVGTDLYGPLNKWCYASFAPKKHAFAVAWREAKKRGFDPDDTDSVIQIVIDGDSDLARYSKYFFPHAIYTLDVIHAIERVWKVGALLYKSKSESKQREQWVATQNKLIYDGQVKDVIKEIRKRRRRLSRTSEKAKKKLEKLKKHADYFARRVHMMNYNELLDDDFEIGSGAVEGAVKHIIGKRCDQGGMRWIVQRNEAVVQLRCIEVNGDWDRFSDFVHRQVTQQQRKTCSPVRIQQKVAEELPTLCDRPEEGMAA